jgi:GTP cyclohydrolase II
MQNLSQILLTPKQDSELNIFGCAELPTRYGKFQMLSFQNGQKILEDLALIKGEVRNKSGVLTRVHSECITGEVLGSLRCDCRQQLEYALWEFGRLPYAILIYLRQEGRGIGLGHKIKAYGLQDLGLDTVEANLHLGFDADLRDYSIAASILKLLKVKSINLMTNNPQKIEGLTRSGIKIAKRVPIITPSNLYNKSYLITKKIKLGHWL